MRISTWLDKARKQLEAAGIGTARLDALVLLEDVTGRDRAWLLANPEHGLSPAEQSRLAKLLSERAEHTPLAYVRGHTEFYGRNFVITPAVLEPRPESETMIDLLKSLWRSGVRTPRIADVGAGSGAIGITVWLESPEAEKPAVDLLEIDPEALKVAQTNVDKYTTSISVVKSDLLEGAAGGYDVLLCNLPYVPDGYQINRAALREPRLAIFGGPDGLDVYRRLFEQAARAKKRPLYILCESLPPQHEVLTAVAAQHGYDPIKTEDFIQVFKKHG